MGNMNLYTSYFGSTVEVAESRRVSIVRVAPSDFVGRVCKPLYPTLSLVRAFKAKALTSEEYKQDYLELLESRFIDKGVLYASIGEGSVLYGYGRPTLFCHRHFLSDWFEEHGIEVKELKESRELVNSEV